MKKKWIVICLAAVLLVLGALGAQVSQDKQEEWLKNGFDSSELKAMSHEELQAGDASKQIAVLEINGTIAETEETSFGSTVSYDHQGTLDAIDEIIEDDSIKALLLKVDSPGGTTYHSEQLEKRLEKLKEERDIPIYVSMGTTAASGGYMVSMPADKIYADNETLTGSIGVIMQSPNFSGFMDEHGIKMTTYKSGDNKDMGSAYKEPSDEEKKIFNDLINESYENFVDIVAKGRDMSEDDVKKLADGRVYSGKQAKENGLVDEIGYYEDALDGLMADNDLKGAQVIDMTPSSEADYLSQLFGALSQSNPLKTEKMSTAEEIKYLDDMLKESKAPQLYYLFGGE